MSEKIQAILVAGGKGTRLAPLTDTLPKPLVPILGKPMIFYVLDHLKAAGITNIAISVWYLGHLIEETLGDGSKYGLKITYLRDPEPLGTGSWTKLINWDDLADRFLVLNADNLFWIDVQKFLAAHDKLGAVATIAGIAIPSETAINYELLAPSADKSRLLDYVDRSLAEPLRAASPEVFVSSGWYVMSPRIREILPDVTPISHETHVWPALAKSGAPLGFYHGTEPWFDSGTHERLARVEAFLRGRAQ